MKIPWGWIIWFGLSMAVFVFLSRDHLTWYTMFTYVKGMILGTLIWVMISLGVATLLEILTARLCGFVIMKYAFGPVVFERTQHGLRLQFRNTIIQFDISSYPIRYTTKTRYEMLALYLTTPMYSFVAAALLWGVFPISRELGGLSRVLALCFLAFGVVRGASLIGLFPRSRNYIGMLLRNDSVAARYCAMHCVIGLSQIGQRPRDWSSDLMAHLIALPDASADAVSSTLLMYWHALDIGDIPVAAWYLQRVLSFSEQIPPSIRPRVYGEAAFYEAFYRSDAVTAAQFLDRVDTKQLPDETRVRIDAALALAEGKPRVAWDRALEGLAALEKSMDFGFSRVESEWFNAIMARAMNMAAPSRDRPEKIAH